MIARIARSARIVRLDNEVIRFLAEVETNPAIRARLCALMARTDCAGDVRAFARRNGFAFSLEAFVDALTALKSDDHPAETTDVGSRNGEPAFRLAQSVAGIRPCCAGCHGDRLTDRRHD